jgi:hypothetical protein
MFNIRGMGLYIYTMGYCLKMFARKKTNMLNLTLLYLSRLNKNQPKQFDQIGERRPWMFFSKA